MKKKTIVFVSFLAVFLMLMIPNVNAIGYHQVENNIKEKINQVNKKARFNKIINLNKSEKIEISKNILDMIKNKLDSICFTCGESSSIMCILLLFQFVFYMSLAARFAENIIFLFWAIIFFEDALQIYTRAMDLDCSWALI